MRTFPAGLILSLLLVPPAIAPASGGELTTASSETVRWFTQTEQALMDSVAQGQKEVWDRAMDPGCVITSEEGEVTGKRQFLEQLRPLPPGLTGAIRVKELSV